MQQIVTTGAAGFVGQQLLQSLIARRFTVIPIIRNHSSLPLSSPQPHVVPDLSACPPDILTGCRAVIHCAGRAHQMGEHPVSALPAYRKVNVEGTRGVVKAMIAAGVRRIVYLSSIKAVGERSSFSRPLRPDDSPTPEDPYGLSKWEAEQLLLDYARQGVIEPVIIRPVLIHGPGAKGNLAKLMEAIRQGRLLPFGGIRNRRSLVGIDNLCDAILTAATLPWERFGNDAIGSFTGGVPVENRRSQGGRIYHRADDGVISTPRGGVPVENRRSQGGRIYHLADDGVISTRRLVEVLAEGMGVKPRLINVPRWVAMAGATMLGKGAMARRLFDDLEVDATAFTRDTGWRPKKSLEDGLREMAAEYARQIRDGGAIS